MKDLTNLFNKTTKLPALKPLSVLCIFLILSGFLHTAQCATIYVTPTGAGAADGSSWTNAYAASSLQLAINSASAGDEVWVACGTYYPTATTNRSISFSMRNDLSIYGGFQGTETSLSQRDLSCGPCSILSGDIGTSSFINDNSYTVVSNALLNSTAVLDGFYIMHGNDNRSPSSSGNGLGGGLYNHGFGASGSCSPTIRNCVFENNRAQWGAGAFNNAFNQGNSFPTYINCVFYNNHAYIEAGGMDTYAVGGSGGPTIINSIFYENTSATNVGAMYAWGGNNGGNCHTVLVNTAFVNNHAQNGYGGAFIADSQNQSGGGSSGSASVTLQNCLVWGNTATGVGQQFYIRGTNAQVIAHNTLIDISAASQPSPHSLAVTSTNIVNSAPQLMSINNARGADACWLTNDDGLQLTVTSPAIGAGNNTYNSSSLDILNNPRINGTNIDIGPYEYQAAVMPVAFIQFSAYAKANEVQLEWQTASELNNDFFTIEKSKTARAWQVLTQIKGAQSSDALLHYSFTDANPYTGHSYYRLKQRDMDGVEQVFDVQTVYITPKKSELIIYPNPATSHINIACSEQELSTLKIYNTIGQDLSAYIQQESSVGQGIVLDVSGLAAGLYVVKTIDSTAFFYKKGS